MQDLLIETAFLNFSFVHGPGHLPCYNKIKYLLMNKFLVSDHIDSLCPGFVQNYPAPSNNTGVYLLLSRLNMIKTKMEDGVD